ncbi:hypothetical protein RFI_31434 [Reticulomyxa filosa]|uniref:Uncharacterized protein n=1 Tax=Reticulomyxa filosa TaxID=46433 RepID=X6LZ14_RETFI|nr:hypothetical protein RFI_31434 [Reticulomyxa filosa]|eukprot:ETO05965.1 hypothetical protein RFI_31434 [Reticulomyxa filosa]
MADNTSSLEVAGLIWDKLPQNVVNDIFSFLLADAHLPDELVLTCRSFMLSTYRHPHFPARFHVRIDNKIKYGTASNFQIGTGVTLASKRSICIPSVEPILTQSERFPFENMLVWKVTDHISMDCIAPIFAQVHSKVKFMSWNDCLFLRKPVSQKVNTSTETKHNEDQPDSESFPPVFENCLLFSLLVKHNWNTTQVDIRGKFPALVFLSLNIEDEVHLEYVNEVLKSAGKTLRMCYLEFNIPGKREQQLSPTELATATYRVVKLPQHIEILSVHVLRSNMIRLDLSDCRHSIKHVLDDVFFLFFSAPLHSCLFSIYLLLLFIFEDGKGAKGLKFLVMNDEEELYKLPWWLLASQGVTDIHTPCLPNFAKAMSGDNTTCIGSWPDINELKACIESSVARKLLRDMNCEQRRYWLWGLCWYLQTDIPLLKQAEAHTKKTDLL